MYFGKLLRETREKKEISLGELSRLTGISKSTLQRYETKESHKIPIDVIPVLEKALNLPKGYLMGWNSTNNTKDIQAVEIPVLGRVAAGIPIEAVEDIIDYEEIPSSMARTGEYFGLRIQGRSMEPNICDGDIVIVRKQSDVESGNIAIVLVNGEEGTCKKILKSGTGLTLVSFNPAYDPVFYSNKQIQDLPVIIIGKAVEVRRKLM